MARAPNPGAPQRVSAHVVPKAASFSSEDDEKTTIESGGWEEEASTTVEQGEVAEKVRMLGLGAEAAARSNTAITSTDGNGMPDEPTVDDHRASVALSMMPPPSVARLVVTRGNDTGRHLEVRPGKTYTIGRGIDNDLVLSDITASRKHFDLRHENGTWILADRGSGNGTLVNSRIEDAPFMLASGDAIEVGNTSFRFDLVTTAISLPGLPRERPARNAPAGSGERAAMSANGVPGLMSDAPDSSSMPTPEELPPPRALLAAATPGDHARRDAPDRPERIDPPESNGERHRNGERDHGIPHEVPSLVPTYDGSIDDDLELSTVAGKPILDPEGVPTPVTTSRPKTLPPPAPARPRTQTGRPPVGYAGSRSQSMAAVQAAPVQPAQPPSALAAMAPTLSPMHGAPMLPQPATTLPLPQMANRPPLSPSLLEPPLPSSPTTLPGQGPPLPTRNPRLPFAYAGPQEVLAPRTATGSRPPVQVTPAHPPRDAGTTALVPPMSYSGNQAAAVPPPPLVIPPLSRRAKITLGIIGLAMFAAIAVVAIVKGVSRSDEPVDKPGIHEPGPANDVPPPTAAPTTMSPSVTPIPMEVIDPLPPRAIPPASPSSGTPGVVAPPSSTAAAPPGATAAPSSPSTPGTSPPATPPRPIDPAADPKSASAATPSTVDAKVGVAPPPTDDPKSASAAAPSAADAKSASAATPSTAPTATPHSATTPVDTAPPTRLRTNQGAPIETDVTPPRTTNDRKPTRRVEPRRIERKVEPPAPPKNERKRGGRGTTDLKADAAALYKAKNFNGAAALLTSSLSGYSSDDVKELRSLAALYAQLGKAYNIGMAPGTKVTEAYQQLRRAIDYDHDVGSVYVSEMQHKLVDTATRAAASYTAIHEYELAFQAVRTAESLGSTSKSNQSVRRFLEELAADLYREGHSELATDPEGARKKLRQILGIVESKHPLYGKAQKLLNAP